MRTRVRDLRIVRLLLDALLGLIIAIVLVGVVLGRILPALGHQTLVVSGGSMEPAISLGSIVVLSEVPAEAVAVGDVVTLRHPEAGTIITHRVSQVAELPAGIHFETKGDANADPEGALSPASWMLGRVWFSVPLAGYLLQLMAIPSGIVFILCLAGLLLAALWVLDDMEEERSAGDAPLDHAPLDHAPLDHAPLDHAPLDHAPLETGLSEG
jgi:signal peptidase